MADLVCNHEEHRLHKNDDGHQADPTARGHGAVCRGPPRRRDLARARRLRRRSRRRACHHAVFHTALYRAGARHCAVLGEGGVCSAQTIAASAQEASSKSPGCQGAKTHAL
eukprot:942844-Pyramimonas_sp.AAC.2